MNETLTRTLSGIVYIVLLIGATFYLNTFLLLFAVFLAIAIAEFCALVHIKKTLPIIFGLIGYLSFSFFKVSKTTELMLLAATLFVSVKCILFLFSQRQKNPDILSNYVFLIGYVILPMILITQIPQTEISYNPKIIIGIFILIWTNDTFAFLVGKNFGKIKLMERVSPKKTFEGFIGGLLFALLFSIVIAKYFTEQFIYIWVIISLIVSVFGTIGDLVESKFKRNAGIKDSGKIMPGHGGILDRLDSVIFVAPFVFLFYQILYYVS